MLLHSLGGSNALVPRVADNLSTVQHKDHQTLLCIVLFDLIFNFKLVLSLYIAAFWATGKTICSTTYLTD